MSNQLLTVDELLRHAGWLRRFAAALLGDRHTAEDVAQEAMLAAWRRPPENDRDVRPWLATVATNNARDRARAEARRAERERIAQGEPGTEAATPEQLVGQAEIYRAVAEIVTGLEEPYRQTLVLRYYDGLSAQEIAQRLDVPAGTIRSRLKRGLDQARAELDARYGGERRTWVRALLPLLPALPEAGSSLLLKGGAVAALGTAAVAVTMAVLSPSGVEAPRADAPPDRYAAALARAGSGTPTRDTGSFDGAPLSPLVAVPVRGPLDPALLACHARLGVVNERLVALEADLVEWDLDYLFALGEPNPAAEQAIGLLVVSPLAERSRAVGFHLPLTRARILEHRFRCRTWACRLALRLAKPARAPERYRDDLARDPEMMARVSDVHGEFREWEADLRESDESVIYVLQLRLRQPSGAPLPGTKMTPPARPLAQPATAASCEAEAAALAEELAEKRDRWERVEPLEHKFERSLEQSDTELARLVESRQPWFSNALAITECRGRVCKQTNKYSLLDRTFWEKPAGRGRRTSIGRGPHSVVYHELAPAP